jgi:hypothetical protein
LAGGSRRDQPRLREGTLVRRRYAGRGRVGSPRRRP